MPRCEAHQELDRATDAAEVFGQAHGAFAPTTKRKLAHAHYLLEKIRQSEHAYSYECPDEDNDD